MKDDATGEEGKVFVGRASSSSIGGICRGSDVGKGIVTDDEDDDDIEIEIPPPMEEIHMHSLQQQQQQTQQHSSEENPMCPHLVYTVIIIL